jgi:2,4-dienoyl-CoA reductase-like NADH-dependent reductase (Old Yellow Enzyme family)
VTPAARLLLEPGSIGPVTTRNRLVRAGTSESMAGPGGEVTDELVTLYEDLARGGAGLIFTGHFYCHPRGRYGKRQVGIDSDTCIEGLSRVTSAVHRHGGRVFAQIAHAGSQTLLPDIEPLAPSAHANVMTGREVADASRGEIEEVIDSFRDAARRAAEAGFDGVHIHGANGYLISEFSSPVTNRRDDAWGGSAEKRDRFALEIARAVRAQVPETMSLTMKLGMVDAVPGGLDLDETIPRAQRLVDAGLDGIEVSSNVMRLATDSAKQYVAVDRRRALEDLLLHRLHKGPAAEAYFLPWARRLRVAVDTTIIAVGGMRRTQTMADVIAAEHADFVALARPLIREPDLVAQISAGRSGRVDCTSCNICLMHEDHHTLRCWRTPKWRLAHHALFRLSGGFRR